MSATSLEKGALLAEKLRQAFIKAEMPNGNLVTASFGVGEFIDDETIDSLLRRIDKALYEAKEKGRNQVKIAQSSGFC